MTKRRTVTSLESVEVHYAERVFLHGALHIFDGGHDCCKKYTWSNTGIALVEREIRQAKEGLLLR